MEDDGLKWKEFELQRFCQGRMNKGDFFEDDEIGSHHHGGSWMVTKTAGGRGDATRYTGIGPASIENWLRKGFEGMP